MSDSQKLALKFFKRNPKAKAAHVVLDKVTDDIQKAMAYKKAVYAKKVSSYLRKEFTKELKESDQVTDN